MGIRLEHGHLCGPVQPRRILPSPHLLLSFCSNSSSLLSFSSPSLCTLLFSALLFSSFTDCRPTPASSVDVEGQVNKSAASDAKLITQRSNCAALAHPHVYRYRQGFAHVRGHTCSTDTYMCWPTPIITQAYNWNTVTQFTVSSSAAAWFNFSKAKNRLLQVPPTPKQTATHFHNNNWGSESRWEQPDTQGPERGRGNWISF